MNGSFSMKRIRASVVLLAVLSAFLLRAQDADVLKKANELVNAGRYQDAAVVLEDVVRKHKDLYEAYYLLGKSYYLLGDLVKAEPNLRECGRLNKAFVPALLMLANLYEKQERYEEAFKVVDQALNADAVNGLLHAKLAEISLLMGRQADAVKGYLRSWQLDKSLTDSLFQAARIYMKNRDYQNAWDLLQQNAKEMAGNAEASALNRKLSDDCRYNILLVEAEKLFSAGRTAQALGRYEDALKMHPENTDLLVKTATCHYLLKAPEKAEGLCDAALAKDPANGQAYGLKAILLYNKRMFRQAETNVLKAVEFDAANSRHYYLAGQVYEQLGVNEKARKLYGQSVLLDETRWDARYRLGFLLAENLEYEEAIRQLETAVSLGQDEDARRLLAQVKALYCIDNGNRNFDAGKFREAVDDYDRALKLEKSRTGLINKANALVALGDAAAAIPLLKDLTSEKEKFLPAWETLALAYEKAGNTAEAERTHQAIEAMSKDDWSSYFGSGTFYHQNKAWDRAIAAYRKALDLAPGEEQKAVVRERLSRAFYAAGVDRYNAGRYPEAEGFFTNALAIDPVFEDARLAVVRIGYLKDMTRVRQLLGDGTRLYGQKEYGRAAELFKQVLDIKDDIPEAKFNLANCYYLTKNFVLAELLLKEYLAAEPDDMEAVSLLTWIYLDSDNLQAAKALLSKGLQRGTAGGKAYYYLGLIAEKEKNPKDAAAAYVKSIELDPSNPDGRINLGNLYYRDKEYSKSQEQYEAVLKLSPDNDIALYNLGFIYLKKSRYADALAQFKKAEQFIRNYGPLYFNLARCYYYTGGYAEALRYGEMAFRSGEKDLVPYQWGLANIYVKLYGAEKDPKKREEYRARAVSLCEGCIYSLGHPDISTMARGRIVEVVPDRKYLYKAQYAVDRKFAPQIVENTIYTWSDKDMEMVKNFKETGEVIWRCRLGAAPSVQYRVGRDFYAALANGEVVALDTASGKERFRFKASPVELTPAGDGVILSMADGTFSFHSSGKKEWSESLPAVGGKPARVVVAGTAALVFNPQKVVCLTLADGSRAWEYSAAAGEQIFNAGSFKDTGLVESQNAGTFLLTALSTASGQKKWEVKLKSGLQLPPLFTYTGFVCYLMDGSIGAYDNSGKEMWTKKTAQPVVSMEIQNDILFAVQKDNVIFGYDLAAGKEVWKYALTREAASSDSLFTVYYLE
jgi:tetratricopeptide (TPR) repeat protein/outer membrane protein assembly factor BamB